MLPEAGDYAIAYCADKIELVKMVAVLDDDVYSGLVERTAHDDEPEYHNIPKDKVIVAFNGKPPRGKVYGMDLELVQEDYFDTGLRLLRYVELEDGELNAYRAIFKHCWDIVRERQLYEQEVTVKLMHAPSEKSRDKYDAKNRIIHVYLRPIAEAQQDAVRVMNALLHPVWQHLPNEFRKPWLDEYASLRQVQFYTAGHIRQVVEQRVEMGKKVWQKEADDESKAILKVWYGYCKTYKKLNTNEVDFSLQSGGWEDLLPTDSLPLTELDIKINEYGMQNCEEFFCETLAYYLTVSEASVGSLAGLCADVLALPLTDLETEFFAYKQRKEDERYLPGFAREHDERYED